jgi:hypothetical protein
MFFYTIAFKFSTWKLLTIHGCHATDSSGIETMILFIAMDPLHLDLNSILARNRCRNVNAGMLPSTTFCRI